MQHLRHQMGALQKEQIPRVLEQLRHQLGALQKPQIPRVLEHLRHQLAALQKSLESEVSELQACSLRAFLDRTLTGN